MIAILASRTAHDDIRRLPPEIRRALRVRRHPDGGLVVYARSRAAVDVLRDLIDRYGTRVWGPGGWTVQRPQLRLPGVPR